jgi:hypothetical protein
MTSNQLVPRLRDAWARWERYGRDGLMYEDFKAWSESADEIARLTRERDEAVASVTSRVCMSTDEWHGHLAEIERLRANVAQAVRVLAAVEFDGQAYAAIQEATRLLGGAGDETPASPLSIPPGVKPVNIQATGGTCPFCGESYLTSSRPHGPNVCNK